MKKTDIKTLLGYSSGFAYYRIGEEIWRVDYADKDFENLHYFCKYALGVHPLYNADGEEASEINL